MKKATLTFAGLLLGLILCSAALAYTISGQVFFDTAKTEGASCAEVFLWTNTGCDDDYYDMVIVEPGGYYEFTGLGPGGYSVMARWGVVYCAQCDTAGTECGDVAYSICKPAVVVDTDLERDLVFDIDCECEEDDPK